MCVAWWALVGEPQRYMDGWPLGVYTNAIFTVWLRFLSLLHFCPLPHLSPSLSPLSSPPLPSLFNHPIQTSKGIQFGDLLCRSPSCVSSSHLVHGSIGECGWCPSYTLAHAHRCKRELVALNCTSQLRTKPCIST